MEFYVLDDDHRTRRVDVLEWGRWLESDKHRRVALTQFECGVWVSTVFLGIDHRFGGNGPPLLFETMVFEMEMQGDGEMWRYSTWDDAEIGHRAVVRRIKQALSKAGLSVEEVN